MKKKKTNIAVNYNYNVTFKSICYMQPFQGQFNAQNSSQKPQQKTKHPLFPRCLRALHHIPGGSNVQPSAETTNGQSSFVFSVVVVISISPARLATQFLLTQRRDRQKFRIVLETP